MKKVILYLMLFSTLAVGCYQEDDIHGREGGEFFYTLPQGNHDYDTKIVNWFDSCGFYILYQFNEDDLYWSNETWIEAEVQYQEGIKGRQSDPLFVGLQLDLIEEVFLNNYPKKMLAENMPLKLLLCSSFKDTDLVFNRNPVTGLYETEVVYFDTLKFVGYDYFAVNGGNEAILELTDSLKIEYSLLNEIFLQRYAKRNIQELFGSIPSEFFTFSSYDEISVSKGKTFEYGYLNTVTIKSNRAREENQRCDAESYLSLVGYPLSILEEEPTTWGKDSQYPSLRGCLHPSRDVNGLVREKYKIMLEFVRSLGIDVDKLQYPLGK